MKKNKEKLPFKLKRRQSDGFYDESVCCVQKCSRLSDILDATKKYAECSLPFCDFHWTKRCGD